jgi:hypothetical protein
MVITEMLAAHCRRGAARATGLDMLTDRNAHQDTLIEKIKNKVFTHSNLRRRNCKVLGPK